MMKTLTLNIDERVFNELEYLVQLHQQHGAINPATSTEELINTIPDT